MGDPTEAEAWDAGAATWVDLVRDGTTHPHDASIRALLPPPEGLAVDAGCGEGRLTRLLFGLGYDAVGFDRSAELVRAASEADPQGRYAVAPIDDLPLQDGEARLVVCVNVLMHVVELEPALRELARVLAPSGCAVIGLLHPVAIAGTYDEERDELRVRGYFDPVAHEVTLGSHHVAHQHRTLEQYVSAFLSAGFSLEALHEVPGRSGSVPRYLDLQLRRH